MLLEKDKKRSKALSVLFGTGVFISAFLLLDIVFYKQHSNANGQHIQYTSDFHPPYIPDIVFPVLYIISVILPLLISSIKRMRILGVMVLLFCIISRVFYENYEISIWCFFAAIMSAMVCGIIYDLVDSETKKIVVVTSEVKEIIEEKPPEQSATN